MKIVIGNAIFALIAGGIYLYVGGDTERFREGVILAGIAYLIGVVYGSVIRGAPKSSIQRRVRRASVDASVFDHIS